MLSQFGAMSVAVIGVRSTSLHTWTLRGQKGKSAICDVDPKWKVNAGTFGTVNTTGNKYVQIGQGRNYQFCAPQQSAFETMFRPDYYAPKLLVMSFLGNAAKRWATDRQEALKDVMAMQDQLPQGMPCIFMTTAPSYSQKIVDRRLKAQENIKWAFEYSGASCSFIEGATEKTINANLGNAAHFRKHKSGKVKDPFHPNAIAAAQYFELQEEAICEAVHEQIKRSKEAPS